MTRPLFEQYKEALRKGHLAARAGTIDAALAAYGEAARLAPDRAAPYTSSATALHRAGRSAEAQAAFERALAIAPDDEATLRARAVVFEEIGRSASAAADLERLAEALEAAGRRADGLAAARHAVELTATPSRRRLVARLEAPEAHRPVQAPAQRAAPALPSAPRLETLPQARPPQAAKPSRGGTNPIPPDTARPSRKREAPPTPRRSRPAADAEAPTEAVLPSSAPPQAASRPTAAVEPIAHVDVPPPAPPVQAAEPRPAQSVQAAEPPHAEPTPVEPAGTPSIPWPAVDLPSPPPRIPVGPPPNVDTLMADATALIDAGDLIAARNVMLTAVAVHRAAGRPDAALDVCLQLLALAPGDAYVHLAIAGLQLDRGWRTLATEKIALLLRLTALTGDTQAEADVHALAAERVRDEPPAGVGTP